jgi:hypothetical protein
MGVGYDLNAAVRLSGDLSLLNTKLKDFITARERERQLRLDAPDAPPNTVPWTGERRHTFDGEFRHQQAELASLADLALTLKSKVEQASQTFQTAKRPKD